MANLKNTMSNIFSEKHNSEVTHNFWDPKMIHKINNVKNTYTPNWFYRKGNSYVSIWINESYYRQVLSVYINCHVSVSEKMQLTPWFTLPFSSVQSVSRVWFFATPWIAAHHASLSITNSWSLPKLMSIESVMPSSHLILCRPLLLLPPNPSQHQSLFQWVNSSHEVAKVLEFQL